MMNKEFWIVKLTSRKFWAAVVGFITPILVIFNLDALVIEQIVALIMSSATLIAYIIGEGLVDAAREKADVYVLETESCDNDDEFMEWE